MSDLLLLVSREPPSAQRRRAASRGHHRRAAYTYAAGHPDTETARRYGRSYTWTCRSCHQAISDRGLISGPADDEHGHARNCPRLAAASARWDAQWEAEP